MIAPGRKITQCEGKAYSAEVAHFTTSKVRLCPLSSFHFIRSAWKGTDLTLKLQDWLVQCTSGVLIGTLTIFCIVFNGRSVVHVSGTYWQRLDVLYWHVRPITWNKFISAERDLVQIVHLFRKFPTLLGMLDTARNGLHLSKLLLSRLAKPDYVCAPEDPLQTSDTA